MSFLPFLPFIIITPFLFVMDHEVVLYQASNYDLRHDKPNALPQL
jgi:hypothetical protein